jgi:hypothetical protein
MYELLESLIYCTRVLLFVIVLTGVAVHMPLHFMLIYKVVSDEPKEHFQDQAARELYNKRIWREFEANYPSSPYGRMHILARNMLLGAGLWVGVAFIAECVLAQVVS